MDQKKEIDPAIQERLSKTYKKIEYINKGTSSSVWKITTNDDKTYAIKHQNYKEDPDFVPGTILRELDILRKMNHPNIVKLHKIHHRSDEKYIDMILSYHDSDLQKFIENTTWKERKPHIDTIFCSLMDVLCALHENNIFHLDIKSQNILMDSETKKVTLCDFGLSSFETMDTFKNVEFCTMNCRPPELLTKSIHEDNIVIEESNTTLERIDVWSLGCVFLHYILGYQPFTRGYDVKLTLLSILNEQMNLTKEDLEFLGLREETEFFLQTNKLNKKGMKTWNRCKKLEPQWFVLIKKMLNIRYDQRPTSREVWEDACNNCLFGENKRQTYSTRDPIFKNLHSEYELPLDVFKNIFTMVVKTNSKESLMLTVNLFTNFINARKEQITNKKEIERIAYCCTFLAIKYKFYLYLPLEEMVDFLPACELPRIVSYENTILSHFLYRIGK